MKPEFAVALEKSIQHWVENSMAEDCDEPDDSPKACALCQLSFIEVAGTNKNHCWVCPIYKKTGSPSCINTPYEKAGDALVAWTKNPDSDDAMFDFRQAALEEVEFLKSLRENNMNALEELWSLLYDCIAVRVDAEYLSFPADWEDDAIHVELNESGLSVLIDKSNPIPCEKTGDGCFKITVDDAGNITEHEITPLFSASK